MAQSPTSAIFFFKESARKTFVLPFLKTKILKRRGLKHFLNYERKQPNKSLLMYIGKYVLVTPDLSSKHFLTISFF